MGADFIGGFVPVSRTRDEALTALRGMSDEAILNAIYHTHLDPEFADENFFTFDEFTDEVIGINRETLMSELEGVVNITYDIAEGKHRLATWVKHDDITFVIAGGASWGDTPEFVDEVSLCYFLGVTYDPDKQLVWADRVES